MAANSTASPSSSNTSCSTSKNKVIDMDNEDTTFMNQMTLVDFKMMSIEALRVFLSLRKKPCEGDYETLVYR